jgi:flavodoxin
MKIGIIVHSQSGHTAAFAKAIAAKLSERGHEVDTVLLMTSGLSRPGSRRFKISNAPDDGELAQFDAVLVGGPVWAFKASPVVMRYLSSIGPGILKHKKTLGFVTMGLPWKALGATRALYAITRKLEACDAEVLRGEMVRYLFGFNRKRLDAAVERIAARLSDIVRD